MSEMDFDMQAAWLRRFNADAESNLKAFALRLKEAMPDLVTVHEQRGFFAKSGNITGVSQLNVETASKRLELLHELVPTATVLAVLCERS